MQWVVVQFLGQFAPLFFLDREQAPAEGLLFLLAALLFGDGGCQGGLGALPRPLFAFHALPDHDGDGEENDEVAQLDDQMGA